MMTPYLNYREITHSPFLCGHCWSMVVSYYRQNYLPFIPRGKGRGKGQGWGGGKKLSSDACRFLVAHNIRFCGVSTMSWLYGRWRGMRISLRTNRSAKILSVLLLLKNNEIQYKFFWISWYIYIFFFLHLAENHFMQNKSTLWELV